jgi:hypothetical protein
MTQKDVIGVGGFGVVFRLEKNFVCKIFHSNVEEDFLREIVGSIIYDYSLPIVGATEIIIEDDFEVSETDWGFPQHVFSGSYKGLIKKHLPQKSNKNLNRIVDFWDCKGSNLRSDGIFNYIIDTSITNRQMTMWVEDPSNTKEILESDNVYKQNRLIECDFG